MSSTVSIPFIMCLPFIVLLLLIAVMPLLAPHFWEKNRHKAIITAIVSIPALIYLLAACPEELLLKMEDYFSFIILLASLFIISGGILITGDLKATPGINTAFLGIGAVIANLIGTTGASMLLVRPLLRTNSERSFVAHIPVFFIFLVSNIGGCLTPIGDPPLFLGYLNGVPFFWTLRLYPMWLFTVALVLLIFYLWDKRAYHHETPKHILQDKIGSTPLGVRGYINLILIVVVVLSVALQVRAPYRELIMITASLLSLRLTKKEVRQDNKFSFNPISEVAILFAGIFVTMTPLLLLLGSKGAALGVTKPWQFFWFSGGLSSFLDNAPTYLTFKALAESVSNGAPLLVSHVRADLLAAISCGSVFMGANTYIGNGPNFMVKSIAEEQGFKVPHFFGYMLYSGLILLPVFLLVTLLFFR